MFLRVKSWGTHDGRGIRELVVVHEGREIRLDNVEVLTAELLHGDPKPELAVSLRLRTPPSHPEDLRFFVQDPKA